MDAEAINLLLVSKHSSRNSFKRVCQSPRFDCGDLAPPLKLSVLSGKPNYGRYPLKTIKSVSDSLSDSVRLCPTLSGHFRTKSDTYPDTKIPIFTGFKRSLSFPDKSDTTRAYTGASAKVSQGDTQWI